MSVDKATVAKIASLARIAMDDAALDRMVPELNNILNWVEQLGEVTLVDLPSAGTKIEGGAHFGDIESVKAVSELFAPVTGEVVEVNEALASKPELVNDAPYEAGWMLVIRPSSAADLDKLLDAAAYEAHIGTL